MSETESSPPSGSAAVSNRLHVTGRSLALLIALLSLVVVYPFFSDFPAVATLFLAAILIASILAVSGTRRSTVIAWVLGGLPLVGLLLSLLGVHQVTVVGRVLVVLFYVYTVIRLLTYVLTTYEVHTFTLYAVVSTYLLLGVLWAVAYAILDQVLPGSISFPEAGIQTFDTYLYYSFVTLASLGYGEITPIAKHARSLAIGEAITGVLFTTIIIARLVGVYIVDKSR